MRKLLVLFIFLTALPSYGHRPVFTEKDPDFATPFVLVRPYRKSIAIYTQFESRNDIDVYQFEIDSKDLEKGSVEILIGTLVPACKPLKDLLVSWALVGPSQKALSSDVSVTMAEKIGLAEAQGALIVENTEQGRLWRESFTAHYYFYQQRKKIQLNEVGQYRVIVWSSSEMAGDYIFEFGDKELWTVGDVLYTLWVYPKLLWEAEIKTKNCTTSEMKD